LNAKKFAVGDYSKREVVLKIGNGIDRFLRQVSLLIELFQFLDAAKGNPVNNRLIHAHHECWRNDKFTVFVIDLAIASAITWLPPYESMRQDIASGFDPLRSYNIA
jgi:hypothetical protein